MARRVKAKDLVVAAIFAVAMILGLMNGQVLFPAVMALCMVLFLLRPTPLIVLWRRWRERRQSLSRPSD